MGPRRQVDMSILRVSTSGKKAVSAQAIGSQCVEPRRSIIAPVRWVVSTEVHLRRAPSKSAASLVLTLSIT